jgi:3-hydroxyacyl-CoA dehydrogenase
MSGVRYDREGDVAVVTVDHPPVNTLSPGVPEALQAAIVRASADPDVRAIVVMGGGRTFIAGADVREFEKPSAGEYLASVLAVVRAIEDSVKPVVMAIHGAALGGGLEVAMAGHYRAIAPTAQVGQPEVKLGLIPGMGGTQRLPRLAGFAKAVEMCAFGASLTAQDGLAAGIVDRIIDGDLPAGAVAFAREVAGQPIRRTRDRAPSLAPADAALFAVARQQARKKLRGQTAPLAVIDAIEAASAGSFDEGQRRETELFRACLDSPQSKALIHAFFAERAAAKLPDADAKPYDIRSAAVVGAGTMGTGIAMALANAGIPVRLKETSPLALDRGMETIRRRYAGALITPQLTWDGFEQADIVIEAVFEDLDVKRQVFAELDILVKADCVLATNTSSLDVDAIAAATRRPEMVIGVHFFSPANVMRLVEIVRGQATRPAVVATAAALARRLGKVGVFAGNGRGFIGNRMINAYGREAQSLLLEGASVEQVNQALFDFGMAMGPLAMYDLVGNDVMLAIADPADSHALPVLRQLYAMNRLGQKTGRGWSQYDGQRQASPDPETAALIEQVAREAGIARREVAPEEIVDRCVFALVNEGARILEEGMARRSSDIDVVYMTGYGFPAWRGGPMFYACSVGLAGVLARVESFGWSPAPLLRRLADDGRDFADFAKIG